MLSNSDLNLGNCVFSVMLGILQDHPRRLIEMKFCMVAGL